MVGFNTRAIHASTSKEDAHQAIRAPIYAGVAFSFDSAEHIEEAFRGNRQGHMYTRISNPTVEEFESKIKSLENGLAAIATSSGMAAISNVLIALLKSGDNLIASNALFGGTISLLQNVLVPFGIEIRIADFEDIGNIEKLIDDNTRVIFFETIANPQMKVYNIAEIAKIAQQHHVVVVADSTVTTPYLFNAKNFGVNVVVHSTSKHISGGATSIGGVIVDLGNFDWTHIEKLSKYHRLKQWAFISKLRKEVFRDLGSCLSPHNAYLQSLGLETLSLRVDRSCQNALQIASFLEGHPVVQKVNYPGLESSTYHQLAMQQFNGQFGAVLSFELADKATSFKFLNNLKIFKRATNLGDNTSLAVHPASTIFVEYSSEEKQRMEVSDGLVRLSVGIEDIQDLLEDLEQALNIIGG